MQETDEKFTNCENNFESLQKHVTYFNKRINLIKHRLIENKKIIMEQKETIVYMEDRLAGQKTCNHKNNADSCLFQTSRTRNCDYVFAIDIWKNYKEKEKLRVRKYCLPLDHKINLILKWNKIRKFLILMK